MSLTSSFGQQLRRLAPYLISILGVGITGVVVVMWRHNNTNNNRKGARTRLQLALPAALRPNPPPSPPSPLSITALHLYPVKGCRAALVQRGGPSGERVAPAEWQLSPTGFLHDRRWMVVDSTTGLFVTQRENPRLAAIQPIFGNLHLSRLLSHPSLAKLTDPTPPCLQESSPMFLF